MTWTLERLPDLIAVTAPAVAFVEVQTCDGIGIGTAFAIAKHADEPAAGVLVTNFHVVDGAEGEIIVRFTGGFDTRVAVRLADAPTDIALLALMDPAPHRLEVRPLERVRLGEPVVAIGSPLGFETTVTTGVVSGVDRTRPAPCGTPIDNLLQTDASINPYRSARPSGPPCAAPARRPSYGATRTINQLSQVMDRRTGAGQSRPSPPVSPMKRTRTVAQPRLRHAPEATTHARSS